MIPGFQSSTFLEECDVGETVEGGGKQPISTPRPMTRVHTSPETRRRLIASSEQHTYSQT